MRMERAQCCAGLLWALAALNWAIWASKLQGEELPREAMPKASGYLEVNRSSGARMFFMYYEAEGKVMHGDGEKKKQQQKQEGYGGGRETPILLWLQGGPGCSSMIGNFYELGPWRISEDLKLHRNPAPWNRLFDLLFLDNPVGTGFSIAPSLSDIPSDQDQVSSHIYSALQTFFDLFPHLRHRPFFITGESYAGKFVPTIAAYILSKQDEQIAHNCLSIASSSPPALRLDGVAIGNGLIHPPAQVLMHGPTAYHMGILDEYQKAIAQELAEKVVLSIAQEKWLEAFYGRNKVLDYVQNVSGLATLKDVRRTVDYHRRQDGVDYLSAFLNKPEVQKGLLKAEPQKWEPCRDVVRKKTATDVCKSTKHLIEVLLSRSIPVLLYEGQFDLRDGVASTEAWLQLIQWNRIHDFLAAERKVWKMNDVLAGYVRLQSCLTHVVISNAGHLAPADQPHACQRMIEGWILRDGIA